MGKWDGYFLRATGALALVAVAACGRVYFDPISDGGTSDIDGSFTPSCAPRAATILFHTTLDDLSAVQQPAVGSPTGVVIATQDFVPGQCAGGLRFDQAREYVEVPQTSGLTHFDFMRGAIEWWYQPLYQPDDGRDHRLFGCTATAEGGIRIHKADAAGGNRLAVSITAEFGLNGATTSIDPADVPFASGTWVHIAVSWDFTVAAGEQHVRVFLDGIEPTYATVGTGPRMMRPPSASEECFVGAFDIDDTDSALGVFDEWIVYAEPR